MAFRHKMDIPPSPISGRVSESSLRPARSAKAIVSLILGIATLALVPVLSFLFAPCGFPTALLVGISAITLGRAAKREAPGNQIASAGVVTAWIGIVINTLIMFLKLSMFVVMFVLPIFALTQAGKIK
jgi:hypothetical protein